MRAIRYHGFGGPEQLRLDDDVPVPAPGPDEVLVRVAYAGVNPVDAKIVAGQFPAATPPRAPGIDFAGVVEAGEPALRGARVFGSGQGFGVARDGAYAEYVVAPAACVARCPDALPLERAAGMGVVFLTAWMAVVDAARVGAGETVVVHGASGGVGRAAVLLAAGAPGCRVVAVTSGDDGVAQAKALGASDAVDRTREDVAAAVARITGGRGADVVVDTVGGAVFEASVGMLAPHGRLVALGLTSGQRARVELDLVAFYRANKKIFGVNSSSLEPAARGRILRELAARAARGELEAPAVEVLPLARAADAHRRVTSEGGARTKLVLEVG